MTYRGLGLYGYEKLIKIQSFSIPKLQQGKGKTESEGLLIKITNGLKKQRRSR